MDTTGNSYYGAAQLHLLCTDGHSCRVDWGKDGPLGAAEWSPSGREFLVIGGRMPAQATLFDGRGNARSDFGMDRLVAGSVVAADTVAAAAKAIPHFACIWFMLSLSVAIRLAGPRMAAFCVWPASAIWLGR